MGQDFVGQDVTGAISLGQNVAGAKSLRQVVKGQKVLSSGAGSGSP